MNKVLVALCAGLFAMGAYADSHGEKSRADVKAEAAAANTKGEIDFGMVMRMAAKAEAKLSKAEMAAFRAMIKAEIAAGGGKTVNGEFTAMATQAEAKMSKEEMQMLRAKIKAEAAAASEMGSIKSGDK